MNNVVPIILIVLGVAVLLGVGFKLSTPKVMTPEDVRIAQVKRDAAAAGREAFRLARLGTIRPQLICPHCQERGHVRCKTVTNKKGVSGGKATGALLTGGVSLLATGLSRKESATEANCDNCQSTWHF